MSTIDDGVQKILSASLKRANAEMPNFRLEEASEETPLYGVPEATLDSLNLISFVFIVEEEFEKITGQKLTITTQDVLNSTNPPFATLNSLRKFLLDQASL